MLGAAGWLLWVLFVIWYKRLSWHTLSRLSPFCIISINSFSFTIPTITTQLLVSCILLLGHPRNSINQQSISTPRHITTTKKTLCRPSSPASPPAAPPTWPAAASSPSCRTCAALPAASSLIPLSACLSPTTPSARIGGDRRSVLLARVLCMLLPFEICDSDRD